MSSSRSSPGPARLRAPWRWRLSCLQPWPSLVSCFAWTTLAAGQTMVRGQGQQDAAWCAHRAAVHQRAPAFPVPRPGAQAACPGDRPRVRVIALRLAVFAGILWPVIALAPGAVGADRKVRTVRDRGRELPDDG